MDRWGAENTIQRLLGNDFGCYSICWHIVLHIWNIEAQALRYRHKVFRKILSIRWFKRIHFNCCSVSFSEITGEKKPQPWISFIYGSLAGGIGQTTSYPLDIVRRRMQTIAMLRQSPESYRTIWSSLKIIYE